MAPGDNQRRHRAIQEDDLKRNVIALKACLDGDNPVPTVSTINRKLKACLDKYESLRVASQALLDVLKIT